MDEIAMELFVKSAENERVKYRPIDDATPAAPQIYRRLRGMILSMEIPPGAQLSESELGSAFGASRTPVREALTLLRELHLVVTRPNRGTFVTRLDPREVEQACFLRYSLERSVAEHLCSEGMPSESKERLERNLLRQDDIVAAEDFVEFQTADDDFHMALADATGFPRASELLEREKIQMERIRVFRLKEQGRIATLRNEHREIYDAILLRDETAACRILKRHINSVLVGMDQLREAHSSFFRQDPV